MNRFYLSVLILLLSPVILMIVHVFIVRTLNLLKIKFSLQLSLILTELFLNIPIVGAIWLINGTFSSLIYGFIVYNCIGYSYFHFFNMSETARRIKILIEIYKNKHLSIKSLENQYKSDSMISIRLERLIGLGQIEEKDNKYILKGKILLIFVKLMYFGRRILGLK